MSDFDVVRHPTARRVRLSLDPATGAARLVVPRRASLSSALSWAAGNTAWIEQQRAALPRPQPLVSGATIMVADEVLTIDWSCGPRRRIERVGDRLTLQGPEESVARRVHTWLKQVALDRLTSETGEFAARAGVTVSRVAIGDPRGRWGSCAVDGAIRYSWRLILAPGWVRRATVAHEVAHRVHMNHSPAFHAVVATLLEEDPAPARAWLRANGAALHWVGRGS